MIGHNHITIPFNELLFAFYDIIKAHSEKDKFSPNAGHFKEVWISFLRKDRNDQKREHNEYWNGHQNVKPNSPKNPKSNFKYFHSFKCKKTEMNFKQDFSKCNVFSNAKRAKDFRKVFKVIIVKICFAISSQSYIYKLFATRLIPFFKRVSLKFMSKPSLKFPSLK